MTLKMLPERFRRGLKLPAEMVKTPADAARKPEDVLDYIPGRKFNKVSISLEFSFLINLYFMFFYVKV